MIDFLRLIGKKIDISDNSIVCSGNVMASSNQYRLLYTLYIIYRKNANKENNLANLTKKNAKFAKNAKILWRTSQIRKRHGYGTVFFVWEMTAFL